MFFLIADWKRHNGRSLQEVMVEGGGGWIFELVSITVKSYLKLKVLKLTYWDCIRYLTSVKKASVKA